MSSQLHEHHTGLKQTPLYSNALPIQCISHPSPSLPLRLTFHFSFRFARHRTVISLQLLLAGGEINWIVKLLMLKEMLSLSLSVEPPSDSASAHTQQ